eukprot:TRINITY_DN9496_c0_g3_i1.p1 TRINITY_DN9496_c0_g3~~TRINITY_DN9496_c0_g3_i1.p1  ORF type:complete len:260 (+),score=89.81 TRINITY_DN9496_c0_g3_i1:63-842(+)
MLSTFANSTTEFWSTRDGLVAAVDADGNEEDLFSELRLGSRVNDVMAVDKNFAAMAIIDELQNRRAQDMQDAARDRSSRILQAKIRGWLARKKYLAHRKQLHELLVHLKTTQEVEAATICQKVVRGWQARLQLIHLRAEADRKREEDLKKKSKKGKKAKVPVIPEDLPRLERLVLMDEGFLVGWDMFIAAVGPQMKTVTDLPRLEEAAKHWEKLKNAQDKVMVKMIEKSHQLRDKAREKDSSAAGAGSAAASKKGKGKK